MVPAAAGTKRGADRSRWRAAGARREACWAVYILTGQRAGEEHGPATVAMGSLIAAVVFVPMGMIQASDTLFQWGLLLPGLGIAILSTALPYSLEMVALTRMPSKTFGT